MDSERLLEWMVGNNATIMCGKAGYTKTSGASIQISIIRNKMKWSAGRVLTDIELASTEFPTLTNAVEDMIEQFDKNKGNKS